MISIAEVADHIPAQTETVESMGRRFGVGAGEMRMLTRVFGLREVRVAPGRSYTDRLLDAARGLEALHGNESRVKYLLLPRSFRDIAQVDTDFIDVLVEELRLENAVGFSVTDHACASGLLALWLGGCLLRDEEPGALALLLSGEIPPLERFYLPGAGFMGDSTAACLISSGGDRDRLCSYAFRMNSSLDQIREITVAHFPEYEEVVMSYSDVEFEPLARIYVDELSAVIHEAAEEAGLSLHDLALILPHNVNRVPWVKICRTYGFPLERVMTDLMPVTGHCYSADGFLNYAEALRRQRIKAGDHYMIVAVGTTGSFAAMVFQR
ncbi:3-oxoacyl-[acyl-carrier-protein] synthase III C-terminal domain-containing protein [Glycomyces xiaoerkulensis]|uniref:3-oxoacyl-[acyl-carrier-protein] synthase III C-terminal domain-containing protein n=1 Tax=Glycomyces xiaoerkulensis TaxID=2038139 RepID=UPI0012FFE076|nr:3-oxoacyl-[acyl-carrier-protein] synthase III C-terminal domain-containing protein [Glycomyces xiaoerkulensis]